MSKRPGITAEGESVDGTKKRKVGEGGEQTPADLANCFVPTQYFEIKDNPSCPIILL